MSLNKSLIPILALIAVLAVAGCIGSSDGAEITSKDSSGSISYFGMVITNLQADFQEIDSGESVLFSVEFENRGDGTAKNIEGELVRKGVFAVVDDHISSTLDLNPSFSTSYVGDEFTWKLTAPEVTQDRVEDVQVRISYDYETEGFSTIHFVPKDILRENGKEAYQPDTVSTAGPISIDIVAGQPVMINTEDPSIEKTVRVNVVLENNWNGRVESEKNWDSCGGKGLDCIDFLEINATGDTCYVTSGSADGYVAGLNGLSMTETGIKLIQGEHATKSYSFTFNVEETTSSTSCILNARVGYRYRFDSELYPITILKPF